MMIRENLSLFPMSPPALGRSFRQEIAFAGSGPQSRSLVSVVTLHPRESTIEFEVCKHGAEIRRTRDFAEAVRVYNAL
jgi:hypothetical protein